MAYIHQITKIDMHNDFGEGPTVTVFVNYCSFRCRNCWNTDTWDRKPELYMPNNDVPNEIINGLNELIQMGMKPNLSILGGDPILDENIDDTLEIIKAVKDGIPNVKIAIWTGYDVDTWLRHPEKHIKRYEIMGLIDYLIDGPFVEKLKTKTQMFGSFNQRVIDARQWLKSKNTMQSLRTDYTQLTVYSVHAKHDFNISELISNYDSNRTYISYLNSVIQPYLKELNYESTK